MNHVKMNKHKMIVESRTSKNTVSSYPQVKTVGAKERQLAAQEATLAFYTAVYSYSFKSMDITTAIIKTLFNQ
jgi:pyruvate/2-oxoglutarate dehydrogenase complex dihydrolipoamide dehydrogenase (E3) component